MLSPSERPVTWARVAVGMERNGKFMKAQDTHWVELTGFAVRLDARNERKRGTSRDSWAGAGDAGGREGAI